MRMRTRPKLDRRATFTRNLPENAADAGWFGAESTDTFQRWVAVRDFSGAELVTGGGEVSALQSRFIVRADPETEALVPRSHQVTEERGTWDIVSVSRSPLRGAYLELTVTLRD